MSALRPTRIEPGLFPVDIGLRNETRDMECAGSSDVQSHLIILELDDKNAVAMRGRESESWSYSSLIGENTPGKKDPAPCFRRRDSKMSSTKTKLGRSQLAADTEPQES